VAARRWLVPALLSGFVIQRAKNWTPITQGQIGGRLTGDRSIAARTHRLIAGKHARCTRCTWPRRRGLPPSRQSTDKADCDTAVKTKSHEIAFAYPVAPLMWKSGTCHVLMAPATYLAGPIAMSRYGDAFTAK
jgi:hypothetical protein